MKTKLITIKGRKVRCRALESHQKRAKTDVYDTGITVILGTVGQRQAEFIRQAYRPTSPLKSKPRMAKAGKREAEIKPLDCWAVVEKKGGVINPDKIWKDKTDMKTPLNPWLCFIPVTISYRKKK